MVGLGGLLVCVLAAPPEPAPLPPKSIEPAPLDLTPRSPPSRPRAELETRRGRTPVRDILRDVFGPAPYPDIAEPDERDTVTVTVRRDGSAKAHVPRSVRGAGGVCVLDRCVTTRGLRSIRPRPEAPTSSDAGDPLADRPTAPSFARIAFAFGWQPASPTAAATMLRESSDRRAAQAIAAQTGAMEDARRDIGRRLAVLVRDRSLSAAEKRRAVFELWDDAMSTAAEPVSERDALGLARARAARSIAAAIERFVRRSMPRGSELGYGTAELAELDRSRHGPERFDPYGDD